MTKEVKKEKAKKPHYVDNKVFLAAMMEWKDDCKSANQFNMELIEAFKIISKQDNSKKKAT